jgi:hypothetical protein
VVNAGDGRNEGLGIVARNGKARLGLVTEAGPALLVGLTGRTLGVALSAAAKASSREGQ